jgi:hypothetical protein
MVLIWLVLRNLLLEDRVLTKIAINEGVNCEPNDPGFERLTDEQIALGTVSKSGVEENDEEQCVVKQTVLGTDNQKTIKIRQFHHNII